MKLKRIPKILLLSLCTSGYAICAEPAIPIVKVEKVVKAYAGTIGCLLRFERRNIIRHDLDGRNVPPTYIALFAIDPGCSEGSAMSHSAIAVIEQGIQGRVFMRPERSFPVAKNEGLPQYTERIFVKNGELRYVAMDFDFSKDALCCPSIHVEGRLSFKDGKWIAEPLPTPSK